MPYLGPVRKATTTARGFERNPIAALQVKEAKKGY